MTLCDGCNRAVDLQLYFLRLDRGDQQNTLNVLHLCGKCKPRVETALKEAVQRILVSELRDAVPGLTSDQRAAVEAFYQRKVVPNA